MSLMRSGTVWISPSDGLVGDDLKAGRRTGIAHSPLWIRRPILDGGASAHNGRAQMPIAWRLRGRCQWRGRKGAGRLAAKRVDAGRARDLGCVIADARRNLRFLERVTRKR